MFPQRFARHILLPSTAYRVMCTGPVRSIKVVEGIKQFIECVKPKFQMTWYENQECCKFRCFRRLMWCNGKRKKKERREGKKGGRWDLTILLSDMNK